MTAQVPPALRVINIIWRVVLVGIPVALLGSCALSIFQNLNPTVGMSQFDLHLFQSCRAVDADSMCDLTPDFFNTGESRALVETFMSSAGYKHDRTPNDAHYTDVFYKSGGGMNIACSYDFGAWMRFGADDKLELAKGDLQTRCL